jgi:hypothetical protein
MNYIVIYLMIGLGVTMLLDYLSSKNEDTDLHFNNSERVVVILFWPLAFGSFIFNFIKHFFSK